MWRNGGARPACVRAEYPGAMKFNKLREALRSGKSTVGTHLARTKPELGGPTVLLWLDPQLPTEEQLRLRLSFSPLRHPLVLRSPPALRNR